MYGMYSVLHVTNARSTEIRTYETWWDLMVVFPMKTKTYTNFFLKYIFHGN